MLIFKNNIDIFNVKLYLYAYFAYFKSNLLICAALNPPPKISPTKTLYFIFDLLMGT